MGITYQLESRAGRPIGHGRLQAEGKHTDITLKNYDVINDYEFCCNYCICFHCGAFIISIFSRSIIYLYFMISI